MKLRKFASLLLALVMVFALATTAFAVSGTNDNSGKITINNAVKDQTYTIYQILILESYSDENDDQTQGDGAYAYKAAAAWADFVSRDDIKGKYLKTDAQGYVTWVEGADVADFAELAKAHAKTLSANQGRKKAESAKVEFTGLNLGYYLVDSSLGTLCSLDTTNPEVTMQEKSGVPESKKEVQEDSDNKWYDHNDADINQTVNFRATITAQPGAENYVFHDTMSAGLTFGSVSGITLNGKPVDTSSYTVKTTGITDGCTFEVVFADTFCSTLKANDKIVISYTATVNEKAVVGLPGNPNESKLSYGDSTDTKYTTPSKTTTYTWDLDVLKYANGIESTVLKDAEFVLLNSDKTKVATIVNGKLTGWVAVPTAEDGNEINWPANTVLSTNEQGKIEIDGLDADTYFLREVKAPAGYNKLANDVEAKVVGAKQGENNTLTYETVVAKVNNQSGTELPSTGGIGTKIFYIAGAVLAIGAAVLLVTKKRVSKTKN